MGSLHSVSVLVQKFWSSEVLKSFLNFSWHPFLPADVLGSVVKSLQSTSALSSWTGESRLEQHCPVSTGFLSPALAVHLLSWQSYFESAWDNSRHTTHKMFFVGLLQHHSILKTSGSTKTDWYHFCADCVCQPYCLFRKALLICWWWKEGHVKQIISITAFYTF